MSFVSPHNHVVFLLAYGFDEDVTIQLATQLRRAKLSVWFVGLDAALVTGQWGSTLLPDYGFMDLQADVACPLLVLPGPATSIQRLFAHEDVRTWVRFVLEGNYVGATATAEPALQGFDFPNWQAHYLPQGVLSVADYGRLLIDYAWNKTQAGEITKATGAYL